jgi:hypothetical protein
MSIRRFLTALLLGGGAILAQEEPAPETKAEPAEKPPAEEAKPAEGLTFEDSEIQMFLDTFDQTYKNKDLPQDDAVATLANLKNAYLFLKGMGDTKTKEQAKLQKEIIERISKKGLTARNRSLVNLKCAEILGELGDPEGATPLLKWLEKTLDDSKSPNPSAVEYGFLSLALIGPDDTRALEFVLDHASKGKHPDNGVASNAMRACYEWREIDGKMRKEFFDKICMYLEGLHSGATGGDPKRRSTYEQRYNAVSSEGLRALKELSTDGTAFESPDKARAWFNDAKKGKWEKYVGPRFRKAAAAPPAPKEGEEAKPQG